MFTIILQFDIFHHHKTSVDRVFVYTRQKKTQSADFVEDERCL